MDHMTFEKRVVEKDHKFTWLRQGTKVEVTMSEDGLMGSHYSATVLSSDSDGHVHVRYDALSEGCKDSDSMLSEWVEAAFLSPLPPPLPVDFCNTVTIGSPVQYLFEGGWWNVILSGRREPTASEPSCFLVRSAVYHTEYWTREDMLRPQWVFCDEQWKLNGVYVDDSTMVLGRRSQNSCQPDPVQPESAGQNLPTGWKRHIHESNSRKYSTFSGPLGKRARSLLEVRRMHNAQRDGEVGVSTVCSSQSSAYFNLGEDGVVEAHIRDEAGLLGTTFYATNNVWADFGTGSTPCCVRGFAEWFPWHDPRRQGPAYIIQSIFDCHMYPFALEMLPQQLQAKYMIAKGQERCESDSHCAPTHEYSGEEDTSPVLRVHSAEKASLLRGSCIFCLNAPANTIFVHGQSGHRCYCIACSKLWKARRRHDCPVCRTRVDRIITYYDAADYEE